MRQRYVWLLSAVAGAIGIVLVAAVSMTGQTSAPPAKSTAAKPAGAAKAGTSIRTPWGDPDLQGIWLVTEDVPLERSAANEGKEFLTDQEVAAANGVKAESPGRNARSSGAQDVSGAYNAVFNSVLKTGRRTSLIIDPPDGKIPALVAGAQATGRGARGGRGGGGGDGTAPEQVSNPETVAQNSRCLGVQMPFLPGGIFAQGVVMQVVQSPKSMGIYMEDDHAGGGTRVIYMDGRPHPPASVKYYLGDSRGHWEGDTLVIETTNFLQSVRGSNIETFKLIERIRRVDANNLRREVTFNDPKTWTRPWTVRIEMGKTDDRRQLIFDSACHEGNYGMTAILVGARRQEQAAAAKK